MASKVKRILFGGTPAGSWLAELGTLVLRIFAGLTLAVFHGFPNLPPGSWLVDTTASLGFPFPTGFAWAAKISEFVGGILLALGLFTRPAALLIVATLGTAAFHYHSADPFKIKELAMLYLAIAIMFLFKGAGVWSIDRVIRGK